MESPPVLKKRDKNVEIFVFYFPKALVTEGPGSESAFNWHSGSGSALRSWAGSGSGSAQKEC
jgi:hypothetical protein